MHRLLIIVLLSATLAACDSKQMTVSDQDIEPIQYRELESLLTGAKTREQTVLVDVRAAQRYTEGHIPGAINIHLPDLVAGDARLGRARHIVVYGSGWRDPLSTAATKRLLALGYKNVRDFRGGIELWQAEGRMLDGATATQPAR